MCGIVGYVGGRDAVPVILDGLRRLEYRGYDSAGIAVVKDGVLQRRRSAGKLGNLAASLAAEPLPGDWGVGHTRWATHGRPTEENAHPHQDCAGRIVVVHNGIIENHLELKARLAAAGHRFVTQTDTEVVAHLVESLYRGSLEDAARARARGGPGRLRAGAAPPGRAAPAGRGPHGPAARDRPRGGRALRRLRHPRAPGSHPGLPLPGGRRRRDGDAAGRAGHDPRRRGRGARGRSASPGTRCRRRRAATATSCSRRSTSSRGRCGTRCSGGSASRRARSTSRSSGPRRSACARPRAWCSSPAGPAGTPPSSASS